MGYFEDFIQRRVPKNLQEWEATFAAEINASVKFFLNIKWQNAPWKISPAPRVSTASIFATSIVPVSPWEK